MAVKSALLGMVLMVAAARAPAEEWPAWRGPRGDGTSTETGVPVTWSAAANIVWKTAVPGKGHSSPVVWGDRVFVTACIEGEEKRVLLCFDRRTGKRLWERVVLRARLERLNRLNSYASSTPATDGARVWVAFLDYPHVRVACYDAEGNEVWRKTPGELHAVHGFCSSLIPYKDTVILNADQDAKLPLRAYIVALDKATGEERWRIDRPNRVRSYTPPAIFEAAGKMQMVVSGSKCVASYDPDTGKQHWIIDGPTEQFVASLVYTDGVFMMTGGFPTLHILGIRPEGTGNVTDTHVAWHLRDRKIVSYVPSPIARGKYFYVVSDGAVTSTGIVTCLEAKTGKVMWSERLGKHHSASPVLAEGRLYFLDDAGVTHVLKAEPTFEVIARNDLGEPCRASPAVSRGQIVIRGTKHLYCIGAAAGSD
jgi:outer membrane protein assembly factor BamB